MKHKDKFISSLQTLFHSWGSDTPQEVIWGTNMLLEWYELEYNIKLKSYFNFDDNEGCTNFDEVIKEIKIRKPLDINKKI